MMRVAGAIALLASLLPAAAGAQEVRLSGELAVNLFGVSNARAPDRARNFRDLYVKSELGATLQLAEGFSIQAIGKFEPLAGGPANPDRATDRGFQDQGGFIESLFGEWETTGWLTLRAGKFTAPFGYGHGAFPGIRLRDWAESYEIAEGLGAGATLALVQDEDGWGTHRLTGAVFTLDTTALSSSFLTRKRFGRDEAERFSRASRAQGGPGNTGRLDNAALALEGERIGALPGFSYHLSLLSRAPGVDGTAREWGVAVGARQEIRWSEELTTLLFAEAVRFTNAGGRPRVEDEVLRERRTITTLGARTSWGEWRGTLAWQTDARQRAGGGVPRESYTEISIGRELPFGFAADIGVSRTRYARDGGGAGNVDAALLLLSWRGEF